MAVIVVEGPDSSGKTTFVKQLAGWIGPDNCRVIKSPAGKDTAWYSDAYGKWAQESLNISEKSGRVIILDRTPEISENIYGPILRGRNRLENPTTSLLSLRSRGIVVVYMRAQSLKGVHKDPMGNEINQGKHLQIIGGYEVIMHMLAGKGAKLTSHEYETKPPQWVSGYILHHLKLPMLSPMEPQNMDEYLEKGDNLLWI